MTNNSKNKDEDKSAYVISNTETFNKFQLTISSAAFAFIYYLIKDGKTWIFGLKIALILFTISIFLTMLSLIIISDYPSPKNCLNCLIGLIDWLAFILFSLALAFICYSVFYMKSQ